MLVISEASLAKSLILQNGNSQEPLAALAACVPVWLAICAFIRFLISAGVGSSLWVATIQV